MSDAGSSYTDDAYGEGGGGKPARGSKARAKPAAAVASAVGAYTGAGDDDDDDADDDAGSDDDDDGLTEPSSPRGPTRSKRGAPVRAAVDHASASDRSASALKVGDRAPSFELVGDDGNTWSLERLAGERFVLYFYPRDDTPGCTRQACDFRDRHARFTDAGVRVLGVSGDNAASHGKFRGKYSLPFTLLTDPDRGVASAYRAVGEKSMYGRKSIGVIRSTFVVGPDGRIEHVVSPVRVEGHVDAILSAVGA